MKRKTREVRVGKVCVGGDNPLRIQSMTTSDTKDVSATVAQILRLEKAGCEIVRMTVQGMKEAKACKEIRAELDRQGCDIPLVADIHFYPPAAMEAVQWVDKIRINPGNFVDKRALFIRKEYDDLSYQMEMKKIEEGFTPLVLKCKELKKALRIGTNHGSLSDRIMNRYGDTPKGMVESALEFARVCVANDFYDVIFSMKSSNPAVMVEAYRLLCKEMDLLGWNFPLHLGVTEAGEGEDGRIKSSLGIGSLLQDGIGDTIRVSLTEDPWAEIDPCQRLKNLANLAWNKETFPVLEKGSANQGIAILPITAEDRASSRFSTQIDCLQGKRGLFTPDFLWIEEAAALDPNIANLGVTFISRGVDHPLITPIYHLDELEEGQDLSKSIIWMHDADSLSMQKAAKLHPQMFLFSHSSSLVHKGRQFISYMREQDNNTLSVLVFKGLEDFQDTVIFSSAECGSLLIDGMFSGVCLQLKEPLDKKVSLTFSLLQAARRKTVKTEFISCPGCGRTLFDLQSVSKRIREKTSHLPGVRIAIMGCIVNGPGEMADADFGYVGSRPGKVDLYIGKMCVEKNIDFAEADERLIDLIKSQGKWVDPISLDCAETHLR
jgi:(E)-4-hydroxy-3-methylbut-2-enyl-diphosphate synthase